MKYLATINTPGYLPMDDDPPVFETAKEAWEYLLGERRNAEDESLEEAGDGYSSTLNTMESITTGVLDPSDAGLAPDLTGSIGGDTPGYGGDHDLGLVYSVTELDHEVHVDYPHEPGRLYDCPACEASCHCTEGYTECIFNGEHNGLATPEVKS